MVLATPRLNPANAGPISSLVDPAREVLKTGRSAVLGLKPPKPSVVAWVAYAAEVLPRTARAGRQILAAGPPKGKGALLEVEVGVAPSSPPHGGKVSSVVGAAVPFHTGCPTPDAAGWEARVGRRHLARHAAFLREPGAKSF